MSETYKEQDPLLCEDFSDEEYHIQGTSPRFQHRIRHSSGRARTHASGAAAIINRWPDHLSSLLTYWWIGLGMIAVIVFVIYNTITTIAILPPTHLRPLKLQPKHELQTDTNENSTVQNVFMHVFVTSYEEFNINDYKPFIEEITKTYTNFKCNFIAVLNDTTQHNNELSVEENNDMALNSLWNYINLEEKTQTLEKVTINFASLTKYMNNSPLKKYWRLVPPEFFDFLIRCIAIWEQGGVAFNPSVLTTNSPKEVYLNKIKDVFDELQLIKSAVPIKRKKKGKQKFNNIQDIINDLENNNDQNIFPDSLSEAENKNSVIITNNDLNRQVKRNTKSFSNNQPIVPKKVLSLQKYNTTYNKTGSSENLFRSLTPENNTQIVNDIDAKQNLLPKFLDFLFNVRKENSTLRLKNEKNVTMNFMHSAHLIPSTPVDMSHFNKNTKFPGRQINKDKVATKIFIDLKGNLIATNTPCHAFIGTLFSNILHHTDKGSVSDFIIAELSIFCKGFLTSCNGVEIILL